MRVDNACKRDKGDTMSKESLNGRLVVLLTPTEKDILKELAYLQRKTMGQLARDLLREEMKQSGMVLPVLTEAEEAELLKVVP